VQPCTLTLRKASAPGGAILAPRGVALLRLSGTVTAAGLPAIVEVGHCVRVCRMCAQRHLQALATALGVRATRIRATIVSSGAGKRTLDVSTDVSVEILPPDTIGALNAFWLIVSPAD
jgi:hypothetical protein